MTIQGHTWCNSANIDIESSYYIMYHNLTNLPVRVTLATVNHKPEVGLTRATKLKLLDTNYIIALTCNNSWKFATAICAFTCSISCCLCDASSFPAASAAEGKSRSIIFLWSCIKNQKRSKSSPMSFDQRSMACALNQRTTHFMMIHSTL